MVRRAALGVALIVVIACSACAALLAEEPTPVPGAAATLTRSINTPIPTPIRTPSVVAGSSPSPARVAVAVAASPSPSVSAGQAVSDTDVSDLQNRLQQSLSSGDLSGIDGLLLDHVSLSTPQGGSVMDSSEAAAWLRDHAGPGIQIKQVDRGTQDVMLQVLTDGWPAKDPIQQGEVSFTLRRYDANGRQDESGGGDWKIDVIEAD